MKEINLEEIVDNNFGGHYECNQKNKALKVAKEAFELALDLAVENAYVEYIDLSTKEKFDYTDVITDDGVGAAVSKQSILQIKDWIKW